MTTRAYTRDVRCKYYNNDGTPWIAGGGCRALACRSVHPSDGVRWENARPSVFISSLSSTAASSPATTPAIPASIFDGPLARTSKVSDSPAPQSSSAVEHFVPGGLLEVSSDKHSYDEVDSVTLSSSVSPSCSPTPSHRELNELEDMDITDDDLATPTPKRSPGIVHDKSNRSAHTEQYWGARNLSDMESGSRSFVKQVIDGVYLLEELNATQQRFDNLRRMQRSRLYAHPGAALLQKISTTRRKAEREHALLEKKLASRNRKLSQLPDAGRLVLNIDTEWQASNDALNGYLDNVEKWIEAAEPATRLIVEKLREQQPRLEGEPKHIPPAWEASFDRLREVHAQVQEFVQERSQLSDDNLETELLALLSEKENELYQAREKGLQRAVDRVVLRRLDRLKQSSKELDARVQECDTLIAACVEASSHGTPVSAPQRMEVAQLRQQIEEKRRTAHESREAARNSISGVGLAFDTLEAIALGPQLQSLLPYVEQKVREHVEHTESRCTEKAYAGLVYTVQDVMQPNLVLAKYLDYRRTPVGSV
ncbi:hypothetical protein PENSPDRAFT_149681 [Peniophora sp. CONT]|nr:hypothetical protein PENSPDRAFT_149681 [Peniophora sp. CONT]